MRMWACIYLSIRGADRHSGPQPNHIMSQILRALGIILTPPVMVPLQSIHPSILLFLILLRVMGWGVAGVHPRQHRAGVRSGQDASLLQAAFMHKLTPTIIHYRQFRDTKLACMSKDHKRNLYYPKKHRQNIQTIYLLITMYVLYYLYCLCAL